MRITRSNFKTIIILLVFISISILLLRIDTFDQSPIIDDINTITYLGVLLGFALTVYTFGIGIISEISINISSSKKISEKEKFILRLEKISNQIREDVWVLSLALISVIVFSILDYIPNPWIYNIENYRIPETIILFALLLSTFTMLSLIKTLFGVSKIHFTVIRELIRNQSTEE